MTWPTITPPKGSDAGAKFAAAFRVAGWRWKRRGRARQRRAAAVVGVGEGGCVAHRLPRDLPSAPRVPAHKLPLTQRDPATNPTPQASTTRLGARSCRSCSRGTPRRRLVDRCNRSTTTIAAVADGREEKGTPFDDRSRSAASEGLQCGGRKTTRRCVTHARSRAQTAIDM